MLKFLILKREIQRWTLLKKKIHYAKNECNLRIKIFI